MKKKSIITPIAIIFGLILIGLSICLFDMYSGYKISHYLYNAADSAQATETVSSADYNADGSLNTFLYDSLTEDEQKVYDSIYNALTCHKAIILTGSSGINDADKLFSIFTDVLSEHPEIFWVKSSVNYSENGYIEVSYLYSAEETQTKRKQIEAAADKAIECCKSDDDYETSLALFDYVVNNAVYDTAAAEEDNPSDTLSTIEGVFLNGKAICGGYARAYQYLLQRAGLSAVYVYGNAVANDVSEGHAWVCQQLGGKSYFSDPTWCDAFEGLTENGFVSHKYFCLRGNEISLTHTADKKYASIDADSSEYNYFKKEGLYFSEYNSSDIRQAIINQLQSNTVGIELKFADDEVYSEAVESLIENSEIYPILKSIDLFSLNIDSENISYSTDDDYNVITFIYEKSQPDGQ